MVFFVLSGYFIASSVIRRTRESKWSWNSYLKDRTTRLLIVSVPCLFATVAWDYASKMAARGKVENDDTALAIISQDRIREQTTVGAFVGNALFMQRVVVPTFGSNTALWSLSYEFWYYMLYPLGLFAIARATEIRRRVFVGALFLGMLWFVGRSIASYFLVWLVGATIAVLPSTKVLVSRTGRTLALSVSLVLLALVLGAIGINWLKQSFLADVVLAVVFGLCVYVVVHDRVPASTSAYTSVAGVLSRFSYSLYATHLPFLIFLRAVFTLETAWRSSAAAWASVVGVVLLSMAYAYVFFLLTERNTSRLRSWIG